MKRVIVIGCPGAGKTTFAEKLQKITGLPLFHLDAVWHLPNRTHVTREVFDKRLSEMMSGECWLIDGNYSRTLEIRIKNCDTVFLFDLPTEDCLAGAIARIGKARPDMPWVESCLADDLKSVIENFPAQCLVKIYRLLDENKNGREIVIFHSRREADEYLSRLKV